MSGCTGAAVHEWLYRSGCTGVALQEWLYMNGSTAVALQERLYRSGSTGVALQEWPYRSGSTGAALCTPKGLVAHDLVVCIINSISTITQLSKRNISLANLL